MEHEVESVLALSATEGELADLLSLHDIADHLREAGFADFDSHLSPYYSVENKSSVQHSEFAFMILCLLVAGELTTTLLDSAWPETAKASQCIL
jgi:hypothetical protein